MTHSIEINELNKFLSIGDTVTLSDVRRNTDYEATSQKIGHGVGSTGRLQLLYDENRGVQLPKF